MCKISTAMNSYVESVFLLLAYSFVLNINVLTSQLDHSKYRCGEGFSCENIICEPVTSCPGGRILPKQGYCGCCDKCSYEKDNSLTKCRTDRDLRRSRQTSEADKYAEDMWIPQCDEEGKYSLKQVKRKKSVCVDADGTRLFGQEELYASQNVTCRCSQYIKNLQINKGITFMTKPEEHCTESGDFSRLQCSGNLCYCANTETGSVEGRMVHIDYVDKLPCYNEKDTKFSYLKPCEKELVRARTLLYHFYLKGLDIIGLEKVNCDPDGTFSPLQCDSSRCSCTDEKGKQIRSFFAEQPKSTLKMQTCHCARDNERASSLLQYPTLECGFFSQCFEENRCFCFDQDGDIISKELDSKTANETFCSELLEKLSISDETTSTSQSTTDQEEDYYSDDY